MPDDLGHPKRLVIGVALMAVGAFMCYARRHVPALGLYDAVVCLGPIAAGLLLVDFDDVLAFAKAVVPFAKKAD